MSYALRDFRLNPSGVNDGEINSKGMSIKLPFLKNRQSMKNESNNKGMTILNKESRATLIQVVRALSEQQKIIEQMAEAGSEDMSYSEIANALSLRRDIVVDYAIANNL